MTNLLQQAIDNLKIQDVYVRSLTAYCADDFEPKFHDFESIEIQFLHFVRGSAILEVADEQKPDAEPVKIFRVFLRLGARWMDTGVSEAKDGNEETTNLKEVAKIEGRMTAEYQMTSDISTEALSAFAKQNASFHVWPYWREIVASQCSKMNLPVLTMPAVQFASNENAED